MLEDLGVEDDATEEEEIKEILPLPNMEAFILDKIIDWCTDHLNEEEPDLDKPHPDAKDGATRIMRKLTEVAKRFYHEKDETWTEIKTPEEIRQVFHLVNDL